MRAAELRASAVREAGGAAWPLRPTVPRAAPAEVHVWLADLATTPSTRHSLWHVLEENEKARALAFRFPVHRERFVVARGTLRLILARYLDEAPARLRFETRSYGKPILAGHDRDLRFNVSHSEDVALYAVTEAREVGVDIERMREDLPIEEIARHSFSPAEREALLDLPMAQRRPAFFACWTRKEAYLKARGEGLSLPLDAFDVSIDVRGAAQLLDVRGAPGERHRWTLRAITLDGPYQATVAVEGHDWSLRQWQWTG
jgi:4'-phosphopantetheinyl transferase